MEEEIITAAKEGNEEVVSRVLDANPKLLDKKTRGRRPLPVAAEHGHLGVVRLLVGRGAKVDGKGCCERTALHWAAQGRHEEMVTLLLSNGARTDARDDDRATPLMLACFRGHVGVAKLILQHTGKQGLYDTDAWRRTVLHYAIDGVCDEMVRFPLLAGADPKMRDKEGRTARALAKEEMEEEEMEEFASECVGAFDWWKNELKRRCILCKATSLHKAYTTRRDKPTSQVPTYLEARVAAGRAMPRVKVVLPQSQGGKKEERHAVAEYVVQGLKEELLIELLEFFPSTTIRGSDQEEYDSDDDDMGWWDSENGDSDDEDYGDY